MGLIRKGQSLKIVFLEYLITVGIGLACAIILAILTFTAFYNVGLIIPANHTENLILKSKQEISNAKEFNEALIPNGARYMFLSPNGEMIKTNMDATIQLKAKNFHNRKGISTPSSSFIEFKRSDGYVVINYSVEPHYNNDWMKKHFPSINLLLSFLLIIFCFISAFVATLIWAKRITRQLSPMLEVSDKIANQELDFDIGSSNIREFNDVLNSLDKMKIALSDSLRENWIQEENKRSQISALTHDLKTPVSIVQGNAELLKETELTNEQKEYVSYIIKNSQRISDYTKALMEMNKSNKFDGLNLKKVKVSKIIERVSTIAREITLIHNRSISKSINCEDGDIMIDMKLFERVIQNIFSNAIQYSPDKSNIDLLIMTTDKTLSMSVIDEGPGFSNEDLIRGTEQFYRGDKSRHSATNYGLGLYNSSKIMLLHNGRIILENNLDKPSARVKLELPLL